MLSRAQTSALRTNRSQRALKLRFSEPLLRLSLSIQTTVHMLTPVATLARRRINLILRWITQIMMISDLIR